MHRVLPTSSFGSHNELVLLAEHWRLREVVMIGSIYEKCLGVGLLALGVLAFGAGPAAAATATYVVSDTITYSAVAVPGPVAGAYVVQSTKCSLKSDGEKTAYSCKLGGKLTVSASGGIGAGTSTSSGDGQITGTGTGSASSTGVFKVTGKGMERDAPDPGKPTPKPYPCIFRGSGTLAPIAGGGFNITGTFVISELSTQP